MQFIILIDSIWIGYRFEKGQYLKAWAYVLYVAGLSQYCGELRRESSKVTVECEIQLVDK